MNWFVHAGDSAQRHAVPARAPAAGIATLTLAMVARPAAGRCLVESGEENPT